MSSSSSSSSSSSGMGFPVVAIAIVGILSTAAFLLGYYVFVIKCCLNLHGSDSNDHILHRLSRSRRVLHRQFFPAAVSAERSGLDPSSIRSIPTFRYSAATAFTANECAVCLLEFRYEERLRLLPGCAHAFHIDCIDTWLASNANCPLCRAEVTNTLPAAADSASVVIEVGEVAPAAAEMKAGNWRGLAGSLGDECVEVRREKEGVFAVQPMRRSLSMDSSGDRPLYVAVQEAVRRNPDLLFREAEGGGDGGRGGGVGGGGSGRRPFFSFGRCRSSMRAVLPVDLDV